MKISREKSSVDLLRKRALMSDAKYMAMLKRVYASLGWKSL